MNTITKITISMLAVSCLLFAGSTFARYHKGDRDGHRGPPTAEMQLARLNSSLELNDEQSAELLVILQEAEANREALHKETMEIMGAEICAQKAQTEEAILSVLDATQTETFIQMKAERAERAQDAPHSRKGHGGPDCDDYAETE